jgi:hypothetical protein
MVHAHKYLRVLSLILCIFSASASLFTSVSVSEATTYYVATNGSNGVSCQTAQSSGTPKLTIAAGIGCMSGGDTLIVKSGVYTEVITTASVPNGTSGAKTTVKSEVFHGAVLRPSGGARFLQFWEYQNSQWLVFDGFVFDGVNAFAPVVGIDIRPDIGTDNLLFQNIELKTFVGWDSCAVTNALSGGGNVTNVIFKNLDIHDIGYNQAPGSTCNCCYSYGIYMSGSGYTLDGSRFANISGYGVHGYAGGGNGASNNIVKNNTFDTIGATGILLCGVNNQIYNNLIIKAGRNSGNGIQLASSCSGQTSNNNLVVNNTVVQGNQQCVNLGYTNNSQAKNNLCYQNASDGVYQEAGSSANSISNTLCDSFKTNCSVVGDPLFVNAPGGNYNLDVGSPAINAGVAIPTFPFNGSAPDIGAFESGVVVSPKTLVFSIQPADTVESTFLPLVKVEVRNSNGSLDTTSTDVIHLALSDTQGTPVLSFVSTDSFDISHPGGLAVDLNSGTFWHTDYSAAGTNHPHVLILDLGGLYNINGLGYLPRQDGGTGGNIGGYQVHVSSNGSTWGSAVASGTWSAGSTLKNASFTATSGRYIRLTSLNETSGGSLPFASAAEVTVSTASALPGSLIGTVDVAAVSGASSFTTLKITAPGIGYRLVASTPGNSAILPGLSNLFNITVNPPVIAPPILRRGIK